MKGLLIKDFCYTRSQKKYLLMILAIGFLLSIGSSSTFAMGYMTMVAAFFTINTISYDEMEKGMNFLFSLPIRKSVYVQEKYLFALVFSGVAALISYILVFTGSVIRHEAFPFGEMIISLAVIYLVMMLMFALILPFDLYFGNEKGRYISLGIFFVCFIGIFSISQKSPEMFDEIANWINTGNHLLMCGIGLLIGAVVVYILSCVVSIALLKKKEY